MSFNEQWRLVIRAFMSNALQLDLKHYNLVGMFPDKALYAENADKLMGSRQENFPLQMVCHLEGALRVGHWTLCWLHFSQRPEPRWSCSGRASLGSQVTKMPVNLQLSKPKGILVSVDPVRGALCKMTRHTQTSSC